MIRIAVRLREQKDVQKLRDHTDEVSPLNPQPNPLRVPAVGYLSGAYLSSWICGKGGYDRALPSSSLVSHS